MIMYANIEKFNCVKIANMSTSKYRCHKRSDPMSLVSTRALVLEKNFSGEPQTACIHTTQTNNMAPIFGGDCRFNLASVNG